jgi:adenosyl cobinamide kinase/adenosyl cobinamide phosphate guanylyltransferase
VSNLLARGDAADAVVAAAAQLADAAARRVAPTVVVSNEVGLGIHPATPLGRHFRDLLGAVNRCVAAGANTAWLVVAGRVVRLESVAAADVVG